MTRNNVNSLNMQVPSPWKVDAKTELDSAVHRYFLAFQWLAATGERGSLQRAEKELRALGGKKLLRFVKTRVPFSPDLVAHLKIFCAGAGVNAMREMWIDGRGL